MYDFSIVTQIWWKFHFALVQILSILSPQIFAQDMWQDSFTVVACAKFM